MARNILKMIDPDLLREKLEQRKLSTGKLIQVAYCMDEATVEVPDVVHGYWIYKRRSVECSNCGHDFADACDLESCDNYCRHCGAKMDAERPTCGKDACE